MLSPTPGEETPTASRPPRDEAAAEEALVSRLLDRYTRPLPSEEALAVEEGPPQPAPHVNLEEDAAAIAAEIAACDALVAGLAGQTQPREETRAPPRAPYVATETDLALERLLDSHGAPRFS